MRDPLPRPRKYPPTLACPQQDLLVYKKQYAALGARAGELEERLQVLEADKAALLDHVQASATQEGRAGRRTPGGWMTGRASTLTCQERGWGSA